ncbi:unannotated protein [freshwater metagenome]|uniref:Unannotated protein n=1 Tax=freshwater metagenome TaxID=449393 RepID=A0A6J6G3B9_9ZZZZ
MCSPIAAAIKGETAKTKTSETLINDCTNAKVRPLTSSSTSIPIMVKPVTQVIPEKIPKIIVIKIANTKFKTKERVTSKRPEIARDAPNKRRLVN